MLTAEKMNSLPPKARAFWTRAWKFLADNGSEWIVIHPDTDEYRAWKRYFEWDHWRPFAIRMVDTKQITTMVMPTQWPEWFDPDYAGQNTHPKAV